MTWVSRGRRQVASPSSIQGRQSIAQPVRQKARIELKNLEFYPSLLPPVPPSLVSSRCFLRSPPRMASMRDGIGGTLFLSPDPPTAALAAPMSWNGSVTRMSVAISLFCEAIVMFGADVGGCGGATASVGFRSSAQPLSTGLVPLDRGHRRMLRHAPLPTPRRRA
jgi:hypothetical protein